MTGVQTCALPICAARCEVHGDAGWDETVNGTASGWFLSCLPIHHNSRIPTGSARDRAGWRYQPTSQFSGNSTMKHKLSSGSKTIILMAQILALSVASGNAQTVQAPPPTVSGKDGKMADGPASPTLTLAPAVVMVKIPAGQSWTRTFQMSNFTPANFRFEIEVQDVVVKDGKRTYAPAGETEGGIAISAVASPREVQIAPQSIGAATVTLTLPAQTSQRGVVIYFRGKTGTPGEDGTVGIGASLGALVTFELSGDYGIMAGDFSVTSQTETSNLTVSHELVNSGREPVLPKGATAIQIGRAHV